MEVAYLVNQYPMPSQTFIRREIRALEALGQPIHRYSIRSGAGEVVDDADIDEARRTRSVLHGGRSLIGLVSAALAVIAADPVRFVRAAGLAIRLGRRSERGVGVHLVYLAEACVLRRWFAQDQIDHVHCHFGTNGPAVALLVRTLGGPTYSFTVHGPEEFDSPGALGLREKVHGSAFVLAISSFGRSQLFRWCDRSDWPRVHVVRCGLDASFLEVEPTPTPDVQRLVCIGRLGEQKGQHVLVEAAERLVRDGRSIHVVLAGEGPMRAELEAAIARAGISQNVHITGWIDNEQVRHEILRARAVVLPSFAEGLPVALMEALALSRAVVTTAIAGIPELVDGDCGWVVPAGSTEALVAALEEVLDADQSSLDEMGRVGRTRVLLQHDASTEAAKLAALFAAAG